MKLGFLSTIRQPKDRVQSGTLPSHLDQRRPEWANQEWNPCSSFFFYSKGIVHKEFMPPGQTVNQTFYLQVLERLRNRDRRVGSFTTTMRQVTHHSLWGNFWLKIRSQRFPTHHTTLTWLRVISFYSPNSKPTSKDIILGQLKTSRQLRRGLWTTSQVKTSSTAMKSGSNAGIAVFDHKEPTLKGINCNCMYVQ